jgi:drug/metabolite transporter (DMT)-like permease
MLMAGLIFTLLGSVLAYVTFWVVSERLADDKLGRDGTPWPVIFIIALAGALCLSSGLTSVCGKRWLLRLLIGLGTGLAGRSVRTPSPKGD